MIKFFIPQSVDNVINAGQGLPIVFYLYIRYTDPRRRKEAHPLPEAAGATGNEKGLPRLCVQFFCERLIGGQPRQGNRCRRREVKPLRHPSRRKGRNDHIFRESAKTADRQPGIDMITGLKPSDTLKVFIVISP